MKKILLVIVITLCIFLMVVLAISIDIGPAASDRDGAMDPGNTTIVLENPANASGTITSIEIYAATELSDVEVATFYIESSSPPFYYLTTRDNKTIGTVSAGSKQTFTVSLDVQIGDLIGMYWTAGTMEIDLSGSGQYAVSGDKIPCTNQMTFLTSDRTLSLHGIGATLPTFPIAKFGNVVITKWNTEEITKWNTIE